MTATQTPAGRDGRGSASRPAGLPALMTEAEFAAAVRRDGNLDNTGLVDWDGDRCDDCRTPVDDDTALCDQCAEDVCPTCSGTGVTDDGDRLCPECTRRGQS